MNLKTFITKFHSGVLNQLLHLIGFILLFYGIFKLNLVIAILGFTVQEIGHIYNHFFVFKGKDKQLTTSMIPLQIITGGLFLLVVYLMFR